MAGNTYAERNKVLAEMGFASYKEYLESELWKKVRAEAFAHHGRCCRLCWETADRIHHTGYGRAALAGENLKPLVPVCGRCHRKVEFDGKGNKRSLTESQRAYTRLWKIGKRTLFGASTNPNKPRFLPGKCQLCGNKLRKRGGLCRACGGTGVAKPVPSGSLPGTKRSKPTRSKS